MRRLLRSRIGWVWLGLVGATALSWGVGHGLGLQDPRHAGVAILVVAFAKVRFVILDFMELRHAPWAMRAIAEIWTLAICAVLIILFWIAPAPGVA
jgi:hypothetical protein